MKLTLYTKPSGCPQCVGTKLWLDKRGIEYEAISLADITPALSNQFRAWGFATAPVAILTDDRGRIVDRWCQFRPDLLSKHFEPPADAPPPEVSPFDEEE